MAGRRARGASPACVRPSTGFAIGSSPDAAARRRATSSPPANAYELNRRRIVRSTPDEFEREARATLPDREALSGATTADAQLANAAQLYGGEFLADEPYAEWALRRARRLAGLAARVLRALAEAHLRRPASFRPRQRGSQRLADLEPLDLDAQRDLIAVMIQQRRHGEAARRYELVRGAIEAHVRARARLRALRPRPGPPRRGVAFAGPAT